VIRRNLAVVDAHRKKWIASDREVFGPTDALQPSVCAVEVTRTSQLRLSLKSLPASNACALDGCGLPTGRCGAISSALASSSIARTPAANSASILYAVKKLTGACCSDLSPCVIALDSPVSSHSAPLVQVLRALPARVAFPPRSGTCLPFLPGRHHIGKRFSPAPFAVPWR